MRDQMKTHEDREAYWTDLSDEEWNIIRLYSR